MNFILLILKYIISFQSELERNLNETHHLMETRKSLERSLAETEGPMRVTSECIYHREGMNEWDFYFSVGLCTYYSFVHEKIFFITIHSFAFLFFFLSFYSGRKGIDLVNDAPENSLMREVDTIKSCQDKMRQTLEQVGFESHYILIVQ